MTPWSEPIALPCGLTLPSRAALAPLTNQQSAADGRLGEDERRWLVARAEGGFGLVSTCAAYVDPQGRAWRGQLGVAGPVHRPGLARLAAGIRHAGGVPVIQLHHGGQVASLAPGDRLGPMAGDGVRAATAAELDRVVARFVAAACLAADAGFAGAEIHGANGYLFTQFLAPALNRRTDAFGGSLEGRARLLRQTMQAVRAAVPSGFAVGLRLSPVDGFARRGLVLDESAQVAAWLAEDGADWIHLSLGDAAGPATHEPDRGPVATAMRAALPADVPLLAAGGIDTRAAAARARAAGVDVLVVGRAGIIHPDWPRRAADPAFTPEPTPWDPERLRAVAVGPAFLAYLSRMAGLVQGGTPARATS